MAQFLPCGSTSRRGWGAAPRRPRRGLMASPFLPLAAWITGGRPLPFPRGSEQSRSTAKGCGNTSPTRLLTGDAPERTMIADWFQSICSMVNTVNKRPDSHALRTTALRANLCMGSESANRGATPADDDDVPSFVSEGRARRISPQVPTVALARAGKHWIDPGSWHRSPCTPDFQLFRGDGFGAVQPRPSGTSRRPNVAQPADQWVPTGDGRRRASAAEGARGRSDAR